MLYEAPIGVKRVEFLLSAKLWDDVAVFLKIVAV